MHVFIPRFVRSSEITLIIGAHGRAVAMFFFAFAYPLARSFSSLGITSSHVCCTSGADL